MKTKTIITGVFAAVAVAIGVTTIVLINQPNSQPKQAEQSVVQQDTPNIVSYTAEFGKNLIDQLKTKATVTMKDSSLGPYVDGINGIQGGTDGKYWSFYIDGKLSEVGANDYVAKGGELIDWKFE